MAVNWFGTKIFQPWDRCGINVLAKDHAHVEFEQTVEVPLSFLMGHDETKISRYISYF